MKKFIIILFAILAVASAKHHEKFKQHLKKYNKNYDNLSEAEISKREENYLKNLEMIEQHNNNPENNYKLGSNEFSDRDPNEFMKQMTGAINPKRTARALPAPPALLQSICTPPPASVDWSKYGQPVVNYGGCGALPAYAAASVLEFFNAINGKWSKKLSVQNIIDCFPRGAGCNFGYPIDYLKYVVYSYGNKLAQATDYPFTGNVSKCRNVSKPLSLNVKKVFEYSLGGNELALKSLIAAYGPVTSTIFTPNYSLFWNYKSGIMPAAACNNAIPFTCSPDINYVVTVVGYGKNATTKQEYWIIRDNRGPTWGESGYGKIAIGSNACSIACNIAGVSN